MGQSPFGDSPSTLAPQGLTPKGSDPLTVYWDSPRSGTVPPLGEALFLVRLRQLAPRLDLGELSPPVDAVRLLQRQAPPPRHDERRDRQGEDEHAVDPDLRLVRDPEGHEEAIRSPRQEDHEHPGEQRGAERRPPGRVARPVEQVVEAVLTGEAPL